MPNSPTSPSLVSIEACQPVRQVSGGVDVSGDVGAKRHGRAKFSIAEAQPYPDASVFVIRGELDRETAAELEDALLFAMRRGVRRMVLNLSECILVDPDGAVALVKIGRGIQLSGGRIATCCTRADILRRLQLAHADRVIENFKSVPEALNTPRANLPR